MENMDRKRLGVLGSGSARKAGEAMVKSKKTKKKRLDEIMGEIKASRGR